MNNDLGDLIKKLREERGMTITEVSKKSGISIAQISRIENGKRDKPKPETLYSIAKALDYSHNVLMTIAGYIDLERDDAVSQVNKYENAITFKRDLRAIVRTVVDNNGRFFSYLHKEIIELLHKMNSHYHNEIVNAVIEFYIKSKNEFPNEPEYVQSLIEDLFNDAINYTSFFELVDDLDELSKLELLNELMAIAKSHGVSDPIDSINYDACSIEMDLINLLNLPNIKYNGVVISNEDKQRIIGYLDGLLSR